MGKRKCSASRHVDYAAISSLAALLLLFSEAGHASSFEWPVLDRLPGQGYACKGPDCHKTDEFHAGMDLVSASGRSVFAVGAGSVRRIDNHTYRNCNHGMGHIVVINHKNGTYSLYAHLEEIHVSNAQPVLAGDQIGIYGDTGFNRDCDPNYNPDRDMRHLHFELKVWDVIGSLDDDVGGLNEWGYTPRHPNLHGYINPFPYFEYDIRELQPTVVQAHGSPIRTGPDPSYTQNAGRVSASQKFVAFAVYNGWHQIHFPSDVGPATGWILATPESAGRVLRIDDRTSTPYAGVVVREQPTTDSLELARAWNGQLLALSGHAPSGNGCQSRWYETFLVDGSGSSKGWICGDFIQELDGQSGSGCASLLSAAESVPQGFGAAYNVFSDERELLLSASCEARGVRASAGNGSRLQYIYRSGYEWTGSEWRVFSYVGAERVGDWYVGEAEAVLQRTPAQLAEANFFVGYVCTWTGSEWKCGCRDAACDQSFWQLQAVRRQ